MAHTGGDDAPDDGVELIVSTAAETTTDERTSAAVVPRFLRFGAAWSWRFLVIAAALYVVVVAVVRLRAVMIPVFVAILFAALLSPVVDALARRVPRLAATWVVIIALGVVVVLLGWFLGQPLADAIGDLGDELDPAVAELRDWLQTGPLELTESRVDRLFDSVRRSGEGFLQGFVDDPGSTARLAAEVIGGAILAFVLTFFALKDGPSMWAWVLSKVRPVRRETVDRAGRASFRSVQGWLRAAALTGVVDGGLIGAALLVLGVPAAIPLAVVTFFAAFFPIVGATAAGVVAVAIAYVSEGTGTALIVAAVVLLVQQIEGDIVMPLIMRKHTNLHPVVILVVLAVGGALGGIAGALIAVPMAAAVVAAIGAATEIHAPAGVDRLVLPGDDPGAGTDPPAAS